MTRYGSSQTIMSEEWELCLDWLQRCKVLPYEFMGHNVSDFAQCLRDGVILCQLVTTLKPTIDDRDYSLRPQSSQFLCIKNIRWFLNACRVHFSMKTSELFDIYDLFELKDFKKVMNALSTLSRSELAVRHNRIAGFQHQEDDIYKNLEDLNLSEMPDEDIYGPISREDDEGDKIYEDLCSIKKNRASVMSQSHKKTLSQFCIEELIETEENYVQVLRTVSENFIKNMQTGLMNRETINTIFINIEELYAVHRELCSDLEGVIERDAIADIAPIFVKAKKRLVLYAEYCAGLPAAQSKVDDIMKKNDVVKHSLADCEQQANGGKFKLRDLLMVPMQRIMKYSLLLQELKKNLGKDKIFEIGSPPMKNIEKAIDVMQDIAYYVNEVKRDRESLDTITMIEQSIEDLSMPQGTRLEDYGHLLKDGELKVRFHDDNRELRRYIFLFDKVMLMCKSRGETYSYKNALVLHNYKLEDVPGGPIKVLQWRHSFMLVEKENKTAITFFSKNEEIKKKWIDSINMAMDNYTPEFSKDNGHDFIMHTFTQPTECDACEKLLAGCFYQGYLCSNKKTKAHKHCIKKIVHNKARPNHSSTRSSRLSSSSSRRQVVHPVHAVRYKAKYAYQGLPPPPHGRPSLKFSQDDTLEVENTDDQDWWMGSRGGHHGYFPSAYVEKLARPGSMSNGFGKSNTVSRNSNSFSSHSVVPAVRAGNHDGPLYVNSPRLSDYPWYIGTYNKTEASQKLNAQEDGVFLVRESKDNPGTYAIGIAYQGTAKHIKITKSPNEIYSIADYKNFESIQMLIQYYETHTLQDSFPELTTPLLIPFNRRNSVSRFSHVSHSNSFEFSSQTEMRRPSPRLRAGSSPSLLGSTALTPRPSVRRSTPTPPIVGKALVSYDYSSTETNQINLMSGDVVAIISKAGGDRGWWKGAVIHNQELGRVGYFPLAYVEEIEDDGH